MRVRVLTDKKALSPVVATILLCGVVLIVGTSVWSFTYMISSGLQTTYYEEIKGQIDTICERFAVEHIGYDDQAQILHVWVYNYGNVRIEVGVYVSGDVEGENVLPTPITRWKMVNVEIPLTAKGGEELSITVASRRQNFVYATYVVPG